MRGLGRTMCIASLVLGVGLGAAACGSSGDPGAPVDDAAIDTRVGDGTTGDTLVAVDSSGSPDTLGTDVSAADTSGTDTLVTADTGGTDASLGPYPAGPYGKNAGDTIANFQWEGYHNDVADAVVSTKPYGKYSMDEARRTGRRYALLHVAEFF